jgi:hypothetical protein
VQALRARALALLDGVLVVPRGEADSYAACAPAAPGGRGPGAMADQTEEGPLLALRWPGG